MSLRKTLKNVAILGVTLGLSACVQTMINSHLLISDDYLTDEARNRLVQEVYLKADQLGGECKLLAASRQYHSCTTAFRGSRSFGLGVGYGPKGDYSVSVKSVLGHWIPPRKQAVIAGNYLSDHQKDLEQWMRSLVPESAILRATRTYSAYSHKESF